MSWQGTKPVVQLSRCSVQLEHGVTCSLDKELLFTNNWFNGRNRGASSWVGSHYWHASPWWQGLAEGFQKLGKPDGAGGSGSGVGQQRVALSLGRVFCCGGAWKHLPQHLGLCCRRLDLVRGFSVQGDVCKFSFLLAGNSIFKDVSVWRWRHPALGLRCLLQLCGLSRLSSFCSFALCPPSPASSFPNTRIISFPLPRSLIFFFHPGCGRWHQPCLQLDLVTNEGRQTSP